MSNGIYRIQLNFIAGKAFLEGMVNKGDSNNMLGWFMLASLAAVAIYFYNRGSFEIE